jgi:hypothetical protein
MKHQMCLLSWLTLGLLLVIGCYLSVQYYPPSPAPSPESDGKPDTSFPDNVWEFVGSVVILASATYLITRKIRLVLFNLLDRANHQNTIHPKKGGPR